MSTAPAIEHRMVDVGDDLALHVAMSGEGSPVVLLHGFTGSTETWTALREALAPQHRVIAVDLPGHGRSRASRDPARHRLPRFADDLQRAFDLLGVDRVALLGYSLGGRAALHLATRHPDRLSALMLESASPGIADEHERLARVDADAALADLIERDGLGAFVDRWEALPLWASQQGLDAATRQRLREQRMANDPRGLALSLRSAGAGAEPRLTDAALGVVSAPTLLIAGASDPKYVTIADELSRVMPGSRRVVVEEAGHAAHLERPGDFAALVRDFLRAV